MSDAEQANEQAEEQVSEEAASLLEQAIGAT
jgi:hypothetical protein